MQKGRFFLRFYTNYEKVNKYKNRINSKIFKIVLKELIFLNFDLDAFGRVCKGK